MSDDVVVLLERLVQINERVLEKLDEVKLELSAITNELDWEKEHSHSKVHLDKLKEIESKLFNFEIE